jgi:hypothetical protein
MTAGWVAASIRGRALVRRSVGADRARVLTGLDWPEARDALRSTVYGKQLAGDARRSDARHAAMEATSWQLRVLAGWLPPGSGGLARSFAAPFEIANIDQHLAVVTGAREVASPIGLGSLATAWPRVARATTPELVRTTLAVSVWGDPGGADLAAVALGLGLGWARRLAGQSPILEPWAKGGAAVLVARERFAFDRTINDSTGRVVDALLGKRWRAASSLSELVRVLPDVASWPLTGVEDSAALWQAESAVARRVAREAGALATSARPGRSAVIGIMASLLIDLRLVLAVIELAGRGANPVEVFDEVA